VLLRLQLNTSGMGLKLVVEVVGLPPPPPTPIELPKLLSASPNSREGAVAGGAEEKEEEELLTGVLAPDPDTPDRKILVRATLRLLGGGS